MKTMFCPRKKHEKHENTKNKNENTKKKNENTKNNVLSSKKELPRVQRAEERAFFARGSRNAFCCCVRGSRMQCSFVCALWCAFPACMCVEEKRTAAPVHLIDKAQ